MGNLYTRLNAPLMNVSRKRKRDERAESAEMSCIVERELNTPKKKKLLSTTQYIYQALFKEQRNFDVSVLALGKTWRLHKVYLCQSPYFASMFGGAWRETQDKFVNIEIIDPHIDLESLETVFGSLYQDEVTFDPKRVVSVLATATLFQLDGLIDRCAEVMTETVNAETVVNYYEAAREYGVQSVQKSTTSWLLVNLLNFYSKRPHWLRQIDADLLESLIDHPDLLVIQTEFSLYLLLRLWMYLLLHPEETATEDSHKAKNSVCTMYQLFFSQRTEKTPFLQTRDGRKFERVFRRLRLRHLLSHPIDMNVIMSDNILPREWFHEPLMTNWTSLLNVDQNFDNGPTNVDREQFNRSSLRCGRVINEKCYQKWRWTGFNFGMDLVFITDTRNIHVKRHHRAEQERLLTLQTKRNLVLRVTLTCLNDQRQVRHSQTTDIMPVTLDKNEERPLMVLDDELDYPLHISLNLMQVPSIGSTSEAELTANDPALAPISNIGSATAKRSNVGISDVLYGLP